MNFCLISKIAPSARSEMDRLDGMINTLKRRRATRRHARLERDNNQSGYWRLASFFTSTRPMTQARPNMMMVPMAPATAVAMPSELMPGIL